MSALEKKHDAPPSPRFSGGSGRVGDTTRLGAAKALQRGHYTRTGRHGHPELGFNHDIDFDDLVDVRGVHFLPDVPQFVELSEDERGDLFEKYEIPPAQLATARRIARSLHHLWGDADIGELNTMEAIGDKAWEEDNKLHLAQHATTWVSKDTEGNVILSDESGTGRFRWYVYPDGRCLMYISKGNPEAKKGEPSGIDVFCIETNSQGHVTVTTGNNKYGVRHVFALDEALRMFTDNFETRADFITEASYWLDEEGKNEVNEHIENGRAWSIYLEANTAIYNGLSKDPNLSDAEVIQIVTRCRDSLSRLGLDNRIDDFQERNWSYPWIKNAIAGNYGKIRTDFENKSKERLADAIYAQAEEKLRVALTENPELSDDRIGKILEESQVKVDNLNWMPRDDGRINRDTLMLLLASKGEYNEIRERFAVQKIYQEAEEKLRVALTENPELSDYIIKDILDTCQETVAGFSLGRNEEISPEYTLLWSASHKRYTTVRAKGVKQ